MGRRIGLPCDPNDRRVYAMGQIAHHRSKLAAPVISKRQIYYHRHQIARWLALYPDMRLPDDPRPTRKHVK